jgi:hypothetical protein
MGRAQTAGVAVASLTGIFGGSVWLTILARGVDRAAAHLDSGETPAEHQIADSHFDPSLPRPACVTEHRSDLICSHENGPLGGHPIRLGRSDAERVKPDRRLRRPVVGRAGERRRLLSAKGERLCAHSGQRRDVAMRGVRQGPSLARRATERPKPRG